MNLENLELQLLIDLAKEKLEKTLRELAMIAASIFL